MAEQPRRVLPRRLLSAVAVAAVVVLATLWLLPRGGDEQHEAHLQAWSADLDRWADQARERIGPESAPEHSALAAVFDPQWTQPIRHPAPPGLPTVEDLDAVNAACTRHVAMIESVTTYVEPPAAPSDLDLTSADAEPVVQRFERYRSALAAYRQQAERLLPGLRTFCGSYPALVGAQVEAGLALTELGQSLTCSDSSCTLDPADADALSLATAASVTANERIAAALSAQCYRPEVATICDYDAEEARALTIVFAVWVADLSEDPASTADLSRVADVTDHAAREVAESLGESGQDRADLEADTLDTLAGLTITLRESAESFGTALG